MYKQFEKFNLWKKIKDKVVYIEPNSIYDFSKDYIDKIAEKVSKELGFRYSHFVGMGDYGIAYDVGNEKVLKITTDKNEYEISNYLRTKNTTYLIDIYDVRKIGETGLYSIVMDKVEKLTSFEKIFLDKLNGFLYNKKMNILDIFSTYDNEDKMRYFLVNEISDKPEPSYSANFSVLLKLISDLVYIKLEARKYKIICCDLRAANVGWKNNDSIGKHLVFFDIGSYGEKNFKTTKKRLKDIS